MSVINKMLKDLDERQDATDVNPASQYAPVGNTNTTKNQRNNLQMFLLAGILIVLIVIGWQLIFNNDKSQLLGLKQNLDQLRNKSKSPSTEPQDPAAELQPAPDPALELPAPPDPEQEVAATLEESPTLEMTDDAEPLTDAMDETAVLAVAENSQQAADPEVEALSSEKTQSQSADTPTSPKNAETQSASAMNKVTEPNPAPTFSIKKTTAQLTPEQHVEKLMAKAEDAYDKGYITEAIEQLTKVLSISDSHVEARNLLAAAWYGRGEAARAITIINDGLQRYPMIEAWRLTAAKIFFKENNSGGAFSYLDINLTNASKEFYTLKGNLARELKDFAKAEQAYQQLTAMEPHVGSWWLGLAIAQDSQNKAEDALVSYKKVINTGGVSRQSIEFSQQRIAELEG